MLTDQRGYSVTSDESAAVEALDHAFNAYTGFRTDTMLHLEAAIEADPQFALPHAIKGLMIAGLKKPELYHLARHELEVAESSRPPTSTREQHYLAALQAALVDDVFTAAMHYEQITHEHPNDLFALRIAQSELFWVGEVAWMRDISERAAPQWSSDIPGYPAYQSIRAFGLEENGNFKLAEKCGREAIELDATDCWGAHAVAHVLIMQGRLQEGVAWLSDLSTNWAGANHIVHHLWWHLALFQTENGDYDAAIDVYDNRLRNLDSPLMQAIADYYVDIQNDVALLQRLELRGIEVSDRWQPIADLAMTRINNHASPFTSAHATLALAAAGRYQEAEELVEQMQQFVAQGNRALGPKYSLAVLPASKAAIAHRKRDYQQVIDIMLPVRRSLWHMGGSHAQRDLFFQLLIDAACKMERGDILALLLDELGAIGFDHLAERSSYTDAVTLSQTPEFTPAHAVTEANNGNS